MKYQALRPHFFFEGGWGWWDGWWQRGLWVVVGWDGWLGWVVGWGVVVGRVVVGVCGVLVRDVVGGGGGVGGGMGDSVLSGW